MATTQVTTTGPRSGMTGAIAVMYGLYGVGLLIVIGMGGSIRGIQLGWHDAWFPILILVTALGVLRRTAWGRWLGYVVSLPLLLGVPIGTILGGYMIWHLTKYRASFSKAF